MHEVSLVEDLFDRADVALGSYPAAAVRTITVRMGALAGVDGELFRTAFEGCRRARGYGAAALDIEVEPAAWTCAACGAAARPGDGEPLACDACAGPLRLSAGDALVLQRVELEVEHV